jgi:hypothetical protein
MIFRSVTPQLHQARRGVHSCVQAAAAARVAGGRDILNSTKNKEGALVLCHMIADADSVNYQDRQYAHAPSPLIYFMLSSFS